MRFATHYGFRPDFCEGADPESKGLVENLVGYVKSDLMIPEELSVADLAGANEKGLAWCDEVNAVMHSEICAVPAERLVKELEVMGTLPSLRATIGKLVVRKVDRLSCVRFGSARYSVPTIHIGRQVELVAQDGRVLIIFLGEIIATHDLVAPGETSVLDEHYGGPRPMPTRAVRPKTAAGEGLLRARPGGGVLHQGGGRPGHDLAQGRSRRTGPDRSGPWQRGAPRRPRTRHLLRALPGPRRALDHRGRHRGPTSGRSGRGAHRRAAARADTLAERLRHRRALVSTAPPALPADIEAGLRRLRLRAMRALSPELLVTAKTQRWKPEEFLRTLVEAEIASRDASNAANRLKAAAFPVTKTLDEFDVRASSVKQATFDYLSSLEWVRAKENLCLVGPAGTGKSHLLDRPRSRAPSKPGFRVRYFSAVELVETLYRGLADNSVGRVLEGILKADLILIDEIGFAPMDHTGAQLFFRLVSAAYERRSLGVASHWPFEDWGRFLPDHSTAVSLLDRLLHHNVLVVTKGTQTVIA